MVTLHPDHQIMRCPMPNCDEPLYVVWENIYTLDREDENINALSEDMAQLRTWKIRCGDDHFIQGPPNDGNSHAIKREDATRFYSTMKILVEAFPKVAEAFPRQPWQAGDKCNACGSTKTVWNYGQVLCTSCGSTNID